jgi:hypothetical protein
MINYHDMTDKDKLIHSLSKLISSRIISQQRAFVDATPDCSWHSMAREVGLPVDLYTEMRVEFKIKEVIKDLNHLHPKILDACLFLLREEINSI